MDTSEKTIITVAVKVNVPVDKAWKLWTDPKHIIRWNNASPDWHTPKAENDLRVGGKFLSRMEARDGSAGFDFTGEYTRVDQYKVIEYFIADGRKVNISFVSDGNSTEITESFETEEVNSLELQKAGWQSIMNNFKSYSESISKF
jgi:uncharacterized protein YndB with AHSA1/START domain